MTDEFYMKRCLFLAKKGIGYTSPNPLVGCVIVYDNKIVGEGWHQSYGESHAEVNAINSVNDISILTKSTLYVNLEPCNHQGKTPPCTDLIIKHKIPNRGNTGNITKTVRRETQPTGNKPPPPFGHTTCLADN